MGDGISHNGAMTMTKFDDVGFLSADLSIWIKSVRTDFGLAFDLAEKLNRLAMQLLFAIPTENINDEQAFAAASYARAVQSFQVCFLLAERGALAESRAILRLCCEAVIAVGALKAIPGVVDRFREDDDRHKFALANSCLSGAEGDRATEQDTERLRAALAEIKGRYGDAKPRSINWSDLAVRAGLKNLYDLSYRLTSGDGAHLTLGSMNRHVVSDESNELVGFKFQPDRSDLERTLFAACATILHLLDLMVRWFSLTEFEQELGLCVDLWKALEQ